MFRESEINIFYSDGVIVDFQGTPEDGLKIIEGPIAEKETERIQGNLQLQVPEVEVKVDTTDDKKKTAS